MDGAYFLYHSIGMYPGKASDLAAAMAGFAAVWGKADDAQWGAVLPLRHRFIDRWRGILNAAPGTVTATEHVTAAFHAVLAALPESVIQSVTLKVSTQGGVKITDS